MTTAAQARAELAALGATLDALRPLGPKARLRVLAAAALLFDHFDLVGDIMGEAAQMADDDGNPT